MAKSTKTTKAKSTKSSAKVINWGIIGYGAAFNMGKLHADCINESNGMKTIAVCDLDPKRTEAAKNELSGIKTYNKVEDILKDKDIDNVVIILPHNLHYEVAKKALEAGKGVNLEKPMVFTTDEATDLINIAKKKKLLLTVYHNRRYDGDYLAVKEFIDKGMIGDVFRVEAFMGGYSHPGHWWRSIKEISGGNFYDWGAHQVDWVLNFLEGKKIVNVTGFFHKRVWKDVTNEDETQAIIRFDDGAVADITISSISKAPKPRWRILGTKGAIVDTWSGSFKAYVDVDGYNAEMDVPYKPTEWNKYYHNLADHLLRGGDLLVKPDEARRVIMVIDYAERSSKEGKSIETPFD
ncbi:MAG: Gfo/Idh/MocA family oxidoreductase [Armatimonadota bacterium]